jgi:outer membrane murein-binding lipoprotein Lpp
MLMRTRRITTAAVLAATVLVSGCGRDEAPQEATGTLEQIAAKADCAPDIQTDAAELRQAQCATDDGKWILLTFATDRGQREWINQAKDYGGSYLVGRKWVAAGDAGAVTALRGRLGGTVETAAPHEPHAGQSSHSSHTGHH